MDKRQKTGTNQYVQFLFILMLFFALALSALFTILFGAGVYENIGVRMEENFESSTPLWYVSNKIRQGDETGLVSVESREGVSVLVVKEIYGDSVYETLIYSMDGKIKELFSGVDSGLALADGMDIMASEGMEFTMLSEDLLKVECSSKGDRKETVLIALRSEEMADE